MGKRCYYCQRNQRKGHDLMWDGFQISVVPLPLANYHVRFAEGPFNYWLRPRFLSQTWPTSCTLRSFRLVLRLNSWAMLQFGWVTSGRRGQSQYTAGVKILCLDKVVGQRYWKNSFSSRRNSEPFHVDPNELDGNTEYGK